MTQEQFDRLMDAYLSRREKASASTWAKAEVEAAKAKGITDGSRPQGFATREEVAVMVLRAMKKGA